MRIMVTGGTGFVGSHCVQLLLAAGHKVTMLVRDPARVATALRPLGVTGDRCAVVAGDVLDEAAVQRGLAHSDALLHAANVYSLNPADAELMRQVNIEGTRLVLGAAVDQGLDPVVHISSLVALMPSEHLTSQSPVGAPYGPYQRSKAAAEALARGLQEEGAPVVITNPGTVLGPHDPHVGESVAMVRDILRGRLRLVVRGSLAIVDVRDVATAHARLFTPGLGARRFLMGGHGIFFPDLFRLLSQVVGRRLPRVRLPVRAVFAGARLSDAAQRRGLTLGYSSAAVWSVVNTGRFDDRPTRRDLDLHWRPTRETLRSTVAWLHERRLLSARQAGLAAGPAA